jgi:hypothetical protein
VHRARHLLALQVLFPGTDLANQSSCVASDGAQCFCVIRIEVDAKSNRAFDLGNNTPSMQKIDLFELGFGDNVREVPGLKPKSLQQIIVGLKALRLIQKTP